MKICKDYHDLRLKDYWFTRTKKFLILLIILINNSCNLFPCGWDTDLNELENEPADQFLIGTYKLDDQTLKYIPGYQNAKSARLELQSNGMLKITETPIGTFDFFSYYEDTSIYVDAAGTWRIEKGKYTAQLVVDLNFNKDFSELNSTTQWKIYEKHEKPVIFIILGDPDSCAAARFKKIHNKS